MKQTMRHLVFLAFLLLSAPAFAAPAIDQAGADALKPRVENSLAAIAASFAQSGVTMRQIGTLMVEPAGQYYAITTPSLTLTMPNGVTRTVGMVAVNAIPTDDPDLFKVAVALPTPMLDSQNGKNVGSLELGTQSMNGVWNLAAIAFVRMDAAYKDVRLTDLNKNEVTSIPDLTVTLKLDPKDKLYSGPLEIVAGGMNFKAPKNAWSVGVLRIRAMLHDLDLAAARDLSKQAVPVRTQNAVAAYATSLIDRADILIDQHDATHQKTADNGSVASNTIKSVVWRASLSKIKSGLAEGTLEGTAEGFTFQPGDPQYTPTAFNLKGSAQKLPLASLIAAGNAAGMQAAMNSAGTRLLIETGTLEAPSYGMTMHGDITSSKATPLGVGKLYIELFGFEALTNYLSSPDGARAIGLGNATNNLVPLLAVIQLTGKPAKDSKGRDVRSYDLVMKENGGILLNGNDMTTVTSTLQEAFKGAKAQGPLAPSIVAPPSKQ